MGNNDSRGKGHWSDSSNVLMDSLRTTAGTHPKPGPIKTHGTVNPLSYEHEHESGFYGAVQGPNASFGGKKTEGGGFVLDAQANLGGAKVGHRNKDHDYSIGYSKGIGGGIEIHGGEKPGVSFSAGPLTGTARSTSFAKPSSDANHDHLRQAMDQW